MPWLFFAIAIALMALALTSPSTAVMVISMLGSLGLTLTAVMMLIAQRVGNSTRSETMLIDPQELRRLRELAEARRNGTAQDAQTTQPVSSDGSLT